MTQAAFLEIRARRDWIASIGFGLLALALRLWHLSTPKGFVFDEVYYAKNARSLLLHGVEIDPKTNTGEFIVHPPIGKWIIGAGIKIFGYNEFGWRISSAVIGAISIVLIYWVAKKLFNNFLLNCSAAVLMSADGLHLVHSRTALLDLFLMFFILLGFFALLHSKHWWAGISFGLAVATKWSGLYPLVAYLVFVFYVDYRANRAMEIENALKTTIRQKALLRVTQYLVIPVGVYLASWSGWFFTSTGWDRNWAKTQPHSFFSFIPAPLRSFLHYQSEILNFHQGLTTKHSYSANPWNWLILGRPTSFFYASPKNCGAPSCSQEVIALGTPLLWWSAIFAIAITVGYWISKREWQSGLLLLSLASSYMPWFFFQKRTMFSFYAIAFEPFIILILVYCIAKFLERPAEMKIQQRRQWLVYICLALVVLNFLYFLPLFNGGILSYHSWSNRMWFPSWI